MALAFIPCSGNVTICYDTVNQHEAFKVAPWGTDGQLFTVYSAVENGEWRQEVDGPEKKVFDTFDDAKKYVEYCEECDARTP